MMRIAFHHVGWLNVSEPEKQERLDAKLEECRLGYIVLGAEAERASKRYLLSIRTDRHSLDEFGIAVHCEDLGVAPELYVGSTPGILWIGYNQNVAAVDAVSRRLLLERVLESPFYDFVPLPNQRLIAVVYETGILCFGEAGETRWQFSGDIIQQVRLVHDKLVIQFLDDRSVRLSPLTGEAHTIP